MRKPPLGARGAGKGESSLALQIGFGMLLAVRGFRFRSAIVCIGGCADKAVEHRGDRENRENKKKTAREASVLSHIAPHIGCLDDPTRPGCRHHGNAAVFGPLDVFMDMRRN
jgi:hypothetical protein